MSAHTQYLQPTEFSRNQCYTLIAAAAPVQNKALNFISLLFKISHVLNELCLSLGPDGFDRRFKGSRDRLFTSNLRWAAMDIVGCLLPDCDQCDWMWHIVLLCAKTFFFVAE